MLQALACAAGRLCCVTVAELGRRACYALPVPSAVKKARGRGRGRAPGRSRVSSKHQITIPVGALREAGLREGDVVQVRAQGLGRVIVARMEDLIEEHAGTLHSEGRLGEAVRRLRGEWD